MKKLGITICIIFMVAFSGCMKGVPNPNGENDVKPKTDSNTSIDPKSEDKNTEVKPNTLYSIKDYYPFQENVKYTYEGEGMEYASFTRWVDYLKENRIQLRTNNGGTEIVKVLENKDGELRVVFSSAEETYYREDFTGKQGDKIEVLLKEPLTKGTQWTLTDGRKRFISNVDVEVATPSGSYKALEVTTEDKEYKITDYYALNKGLVKTIFTSKGTEVKSSLSKIETKAALVQNIKFYYPNFNDNKIYYVKKTISFNTNDITKMIFEKNFKETPKKELSRLLGTNTKIKSLYLNKDGMLYVDFTKELVSEMNAGSSLESMILQSIVNTLGDYYGVDKVYITIEGEPYSSGHILKKKGEPFKVDTRSAVELKL